MIIERYKSKDEYKILDLFKLSFNKEMSLDYWNWRFKNNPFTDDIFVDLMWDNEKLVGHYAVSPVEMIIQNDKLLTALSMTTMTHPAYGGKGIFSNLAESIYSKLKESDYKFVWGFPNNNSHYGFIKNLKWNNIAVQASMTLHVELLKNTSIENLIYYSNFEDIADLFNSSQFCIRINKTKKYLNWRYVLNPVNDYKIAINENKTIGVVYKVFKSFINNEKNEIDILELFHNNDYSNLLIFINSIISQEDKVIKINLWESLFSNNQIVLEKVGFRLSNFNTYFGFRPLSLVEGVDDYKNWELNLGYSDVF